jgi:DNA-directed RNA polymerase specialized sigma24 family protein
MGAESDGELMPFPTTHWSQVERAGVEGARQALGALLQRYLPALRAHLLLERGIPADRVEDLLQGFVADKIVEQNLVAQARQAKGKFRSFLLVSLNRYVVSQFRHDKAAIRSPGDASMVNLESLGALASGEVEPSEQFNAAWSREMVAEAKRRMRAECERANRMDVWAIFSERILGPVEDGTSPRSYEQLAGSLELNSSMQASNLLITGKRAFARVLRSLIAEYVEDEAMIDEEIGDLMHALSRTGA